MGRTKCKYLKRNMCIQLGVKCLEKKWLSGIGAGECGFAERVSTVPPRPAPPRPPGAE